LLGINQVYYLRIICKTHKHYNYLQLTLKQKVFTKVIENAKLVDWIGKPGGSFSGGSKAQVLEVNVTESA
jgi:hypothetical protein